MNSRGAKREDTRFAPEPKAEDAKPSDGESPKGGDAK